MVLVTQLGSYYKDLQDERFESALALVHQRFATNTFPTWQLAHPYRMIAHNGEIKTLSGNGLRPARYLVTRDGLVVMASEMGVLPIPEETIVEKWRLQPGKMLLIDLEEGRIVSDDEIKQQLAARHPYKDWLRRTQIVLEALKPVQARESRTDVSLLDRQQAFGYTQEDLQLLMHPRG